MIRYHVWWPSSGDPFYQANIPENTARKNYYVFNYVPYLWIDGIVDGNGAPAEWDSLVTVRAEEESPLSIEVTVEYDSLSMAGTVYAQIVATQPITHGDLRVRWVITESEIPFNAPNGEKIHNQVMRDMIPDATGEPITIAQGDTLNLSQPFTIAHTWDDHWCAVVVFVQSDPTLMDGNREVLQTGMAWINPIPRLEFVGRSVDDGPGGNGNGIAEPGEIVGLTVSLKNTGNAAAHSVAAILSTGDPYISIPTDSADFGDIEPYMTVPSLNPYVLQVAAGTPQPHSAMLDLDISGEEYAVADSFWVTVDNTAGLFDNMEGGVGGWTHGGMLDYWDQTDHRVHTPNTSWYCGNQMNWQYLNNMDASLVSPLVTVSSGGELHVWQWYALESGYDYGYIEVADGPDSSWTKIGSVNGYSDGFAAHIYDLSAFGSVAVRVRFRMDSDSGVIDEGWYVDDVVITWPTIALDLVPDATTVPRGGTLGFTATLANNLDQSQTFYGISEVSLPGGVYFAGNPLVGPERVTVGPQGTVERHMTHQIPGAAPLGDYVYEVTIGRPPDKVIDRQRFVFTVVP
ncbi:hypothetical protein AMJ71_00085 [candidate division TA06 bacterium SM1_40]|uniref:CARDB domain-containing protein n=1 Tax=candidate division TA06 bacterium SM1_40 TaxID=1703773 RepID=A0A0S8JSA1_UNCT6|nr:MAG: hypothetical protein AMJ71_00085 [candidate division TA06 bacterium SM1_40]